MFSNMKRVVCCYFAVSMIPLYEFSELDCMKPQLLLERSCDSDNNTSLKMYTFTQSRLEIAISDDCDIAFDAPYHLNDTFYIECDTEEIDCYNDDEEKIPKQTYHLECEEFDAAGSKEAVKHSVTENVPDTPKVAMILGCSVGALGSTVLLAYGAYKLKTLLQSGTYLIPDTNNAPGCP